MKWMIADGYAGCARSSAASRRRRPGWPKPTLLKADADAEYAAVIEIDLADVQEPIVACPNDPDDVKTLSEVAGAKIDEAFIGSCMTNIGHFRAASEAAREQARHPGQAVGRAADQDGPGAERRKATTACFGTAGARMEMPGCSLCMGNQAQVKEGATVFDLDAQLPEPPGQEHQRLPGLGRTGGHRLAWALAGALFFLAAEVSGRDLVAFALVALTAAALVNTSFDLVAATVFAVPAVAPMLIPLVAPRSASPPAALLVGVLMLGIVTMVALRMRRSWLAGLAARVDEARRSDAALRSAELLDRTGALAQVGAWELCLSTQQLRLSTQSWLLLDLEPRAEPATLAVILQCCGPEEQAQLQAAIERVVQQAHPFGLELRLATTRGRTVTMRFIGHPGLEGGRVVRVDGAMQDVTQLRAIDRALADKHELLEQLLRTTGQGFWFIDNQGRTTDVNPAMCSLLGRDRNELLGRRATEFFDGPDLEVIRRELALRARGERGGYEIGITRPDGSRVQCFNSASPIVDARGQQVGSVGIWTDLSARHAAEASLRIFEAVTNSTADMISVIDDRELYLVVNDAWCRATGLRREAVLGRTTMDVLPHEGTAARRAAVRGAIEAQRTSTVRTAVNFPGIGPRHMESTYYPFADDGSGRGRVVIISRDVTREEQDRAALAASADAQRALLDAFPGYIAVVDGQGRYAYMNDRLAAIFGRTAAEVIGVDMAQVVGEERAGRLRQVIDKVLRDGRSSSESTYPATASRGAIDLEIDHIAGPVQADGSRNIFAFAIDVTERRRAQAALVVALQQAERANAAKSMFLSSMSHELRTPMNAILGFGQLLEAEDAPRLSERQLNFVQEILRGGQHLLNLINDLLDLGSIEAGELKTDCQLLPLGGVIDDCVALVDPLAQARQVTLSCQLGQRDRLHAWADPKRLRQVLLNLLSNGIKYNRHGGRVEVSAGTQGPWLEISVRDTGPGLSPEQQQRLFTPFERLEARHGSIEGTGIGLALSRRLVEAMGRRHRGRQPARPRLHLSHPAAPAGSTAVARSRSPGPPAPRSRDAGGPAGRPQSALHRGQRRQRDADGSHAGRRDAGDQRAGSAGRTGAGAGAATRCRAARPAVARHRWLRGAAAAACRPTHGAYPGSRRQRQRHLGQRAGRAGRRLRRVLDQTAEHRVAAGHAGRGGRDFRADVHDAARVGQGPDLSQVRLHAFG
jgi:PAS domain S-box-containing protein